MRCAHHRCDQEIVGRSAAALYCSERCSRNAGKCRAYKRHPRKKPPRPPNVRVCTICSRQFLQRKGMPALTCSEAHRRERDSLVTKARHVPTPHALRRAALRLFKHEHPDLWAAQRRDKARKNTAARRARLTSEQLLAKLEYDRQRRRSMTPKQRDELREYKNSKARQQRGKAMAYDRIMAMAEAGQ
jgi:hypothetical protein